MDYYASAWRAINKKEYINNLIEKYHCTQEELFGLMIIIDRIKKYHLIEEVCKEYDKKERLKENIKQRKQMMKRMKIKI